MQAKNGYVKSESFQVSSDSVVGMSMVPVNVNIKGQHKKVLTYVFLDLGSNTSFCTEDLLKKLNAKGERATSRSLPWENLTKASNVLS